MEGRPYKRRAVRSKLYGFDCRGYRQKYSVCSITMYFLYSTRAN